MKELKLGPVLDISGAAELKDWLLLALEEGEALDVHAEGVDKVDAAGLQLLAAFMSEMTARGVPVRFVSLSASLLEAMRLLGLEPVFADAVSAAAVD